MSNALYCRLAALSVALIGIGAFPHAAAQDPSATTSTRSTKQAAAPKFGIDGLRAEFGRVGGGRDAASYAYVRAVPYMRWKPARNWEVEAGAVLDAEHQADGPAGFDRTDASAADTFVRWRTGETRWTAGWQTIIWGRVDETPLIDRVSRVDLNRLVLDPLAERRLPMPALRWEQAFGDFNLDLVAIAEHRRARLSDPDSVWFPVDRRRGQIVGLDLPPALSAFVSAATVTHAAHAAGGVGMRLRHDAQDGPSLGLTLARTRQSLPHFVADLSSMTLQQVHPFVRFAGVDAEWNAAGMTWRTEFGYSLDVPATGLQGQMLKARAVEWAAGVEFFPGDGDLRINAQLLGRRLRADAALLERRELVALGGEAELPLDQGRWKLGLRLSSGLTAHDLYLAPRVVFAGWEPHELYLTLHAFDGEAGTLGGFHRRHDTITFGLTTRF